jgi:hypothetical protein
MKGWLGALFGFFSRGGGGGGGSSGAQRPGPGAPGADEPAAVAPDLAALIGFPVEIVPGERALARWEALRAAGKGYPVIVGDAEALDRLAEQMEFAEDAGEEAAAILARAAQIAWPQAMFDARRADQAAYAAEFPDVFDEEYGAEVGDWPAAVDTSVALTVHADILTGKPFPVCHIVILPVDHGWEVPAHLAWGGWNENPEPALHVAALKSWHERYGAELVGMSGDVLNLRVTRRPATRDEALELAREHYAYCADIVDQGVETLSALAATTMASDWWYFWWD